MKWAEIPVPLKNMKAWGAMDEKGFSFVISMDEQDDPPVYHCSYKDDSERKQPFVKMAHQIGEGFDRLRDAMIACEVKSKELVQ